MHFSFLFLHIHTRHTFSKLFDEIMMYINEECFSYFIKDMWFGYVFVEMLIYCKTYIFTYFILCCFFVFFYCRHFLGLSRMKVLACR